MWPRRAGHDAELGGSYEEKKSMQERGSVLIVIEVVPKIIRQSEVSLQLREHITNDDIRCP